MKDIKIKDILLLGSAALLFFALQDHPYVYYQILRWVVSGVSLYVIFRNKKQEFSYLFMVPTILFNPIIPFYFSKNNWHILDVVFGILFVVYLIIYRKLELDGSIRTEKISEYIDTEDNSQESTSLQKILKVALIQSRAKLDTKKKNKDQ